MDSLLLIIKYIFRSKNIENKDDSIDEFFENGLSFPKFISIILDVDEIPKINKDPKSEISKMENNDIALQFLFQKNDVIANLKPEYKNKDDKSNLLLLILTKQYFKIDIKSIIDKCNLIVEPLDIKFEKKSDILTINCLLSLLNILTDGKIQITKDIKSMDDFDQKIAQIFKQFHAPLIINKNSLDYENQNIFLIQIEILFDFFSDKIRQIENQSKQKVTKLQKEEEEEEEEEDSIKSKTDRKKYKSLKNNEWDVIDQKSIKKWEKKKYDSNLSSDNDENINIEENIEESLLKTINIIGSGQFHFNNFHESIINDSIPKFVMFFFNIKTIKNVQIKTANQASQKITKEEINNIKSVIKFLSTKEIKFKILKFNFEDKSTEESSAVLFYSNFLNFFYVKNYISEIYKRCENILCTKKLFNHYDNYLELIEPQTFAALLHFYTQKNLNFNIKKLPNKVKEIEKYFTKAKVPMIINNTILDIGCGDLIADAVLYQYQMIFDAIDSGPKSLAILEILLSAIRKFMNVKVIKSYNRKLYNQNIKSKQSQYLKKSHSTNVSSFEDIKTQNETESTISLNTFKNRFKKSNSNEKYEKSNSNQTNSFEFFWDSIESDFGYYKGIIFNKSTDKTKNQKNWTKEIKNLLKNKTKHEIKKSSDQQYVSFKNSQSSFVSKLYKLFCYDETNKSWTFQHENFERFAKDKRIDIGESKTPIIFLLNSIEEDSISLTTNLINGIYPQIDSEQDIFVYSFCDKPLSMLNYNVDFLSREKSSIKPIFLLLHVPKSKEKLPNIELIIFEIYSILMLLSDLKIVILNENYYLNQIETIKIFNDIYQSIKMESNQQFDDDCSLIDNSKDNTDDIDNDDDYEIEEEEKWENEYKYEKKISKNDSLINIHYKNPKTIFLINNSSVKSSISIENNLKENQFFNNFIKNIEAEIHPINIKDPDSYEIFLQSLNDSLISLNTKFSEIRNNFDSILYLKTSFSYSKIRLNESTWKEKLKEIILRRKLELEKNVKNDYDLLNLLSDLNNELHHITAKFDSQFINECNSILSDIKTKNFKKNREFYSSELQISAESHLKCLEERINQKYFWNEEQIDLVKKNHSIFLKNEFFDIIKLTNPEKVFRFVYEANIDVLNDQIQKNKLEIQKKFKQFIDLINMKKNRKEQNLKEEVQKGVNYSMNETESIKEIKIIVQAGKDLISEIEQDF